MSARVGIELGPELVRAVRLERWRRPQQVLELHWDPDAPSSLAEALREALGTGARVAVTLDLAFLFAKQVRLPPVSVEEKRRILSLEPERFFPVRGEELVLAVRGDDNLVFASRASLLGSWLTALEILGPVELVEPSPVSLARALGRIEPEEATLVLQEPGDEVGIAEIGGGRVHRVHRTGDLSQVATLSQNGNGARKTYLRPLNGNTGWTPAETFHPAPLPAIAGVTSSHLAAYGAALGIGARVDESLLPSDLAARATRRRRRSGVLAAITCLLGLCFALLSLDAYRGRALQKLEAESAELRPAGERALALQGQSDALAQEARAIRAIETERIDPLSDLRALTQRLPAAAYLTALRGTGQDWQIDGFAPEAAPLVGRLEEDPRFDRVHFLSATSRTRLNGKLYESFSIGLHLVPAP